jgi:branched-chain amino acid transport system permease protein
MTVAPSVEKSVQEQPRTWAYWLDPTRIPAHIWIIAVILLLVPTFTSEFTQYQIFGWAFILGMISLSLMILAGYGGMVSLVQMTAACVGRLRHCYIWYKRSN